MQALGLLLLIPALPIIFLLVVLVRCTSAGPGIYGQTRVGRRGHPFTMYKIRTMHQDAEAASGPTWCLPGDSRITCVGRVLRFLHLDELPQLFNIIRGEMDLIGPRPERPIFVDKFVEEIPDYAERLAVLPGVTGLAQINLPPDETTDCVRRKLALDLEYIQTATFSLDLRILACTALRMMGIRHGHAVNLFKLNRSTHYIEPIIETQDSNIAATSPAMSAIFAANSNGYYHNGNGNGNGNTPKPHLQTVTTDTSEEIPVSTAPRNPK
jgi:lipopolysaccharide/colanic/teichoic acid biosynthesis glycosyltransferase